MSREGTLPVRIRSGEPCLTVGSTIFELRLTL